MLLDPLLGTVPGTRSFYSPRTRRNPPSENATNLRVGGDAVNVPARAATVHIRGAPKSTGDSTPKGSEANRGADSDRGETCPFRGMPRKSREIWFGMGGGTGGQAAGPRCESCRLLAGLPNRGGGTGSRNSLTRGRRQYGDPPRPRKGDHAASPEAGVRDARAARTPSDRSRATGLTPVCRGGPADRSRAAPRQRARAERRGTSAGRVRRSRTAGRPAGASRRRRAPARARRRRPAAGDHRQRAAGRRAAGQRGAPCECGSRTSATRRRSSPRRRVDHGQRRRQHAERGQEEGGEPLREPHQREVTVHRLGLEDPEVGIHVAPGGRERERCPPGRDRDPAHYGQRPREPLRIGQTDHVARRPHLDTTTLPPWEVVGVAANIVALPD